MIESFIINSGTFLVCNAVILSGAIEICLFLPKEVLDYNSLGAFMYFWK